MNIAICLDGSEKAITQSLTNFRQAGIPFFSYEECETSYDECGSSYFSSKKLVDGWEQSCLIGHPIDFCDAYIFIRSRDYTLVLLSACGVNIDILSPERLLIQKAYRMASPYGQ